jgi:hypothetical protein
MPDFDLQPVRLHRPICDCDSELIAYALNLSAWHRHRFAGTFVTHARGDGLSVFVIVVYILSEGDGPHARQIANFRRRKWAVIKEIRINIKPDVSSSAHGAHVIVKKGAI